MTEEEKKVIEAARRVVTAWWAEDDNMVNVAEEIEVLEAALKDAGLLPEGPD
jgi:hypothetical protein